MGSSKCVLYVALVACVLYAAHDSAKETDPIYHWIHNQRGVGHEEPKYLSRPVFRVDYGHRVELLAKDGSWRRVQPQGDHPPGWLHSSDLLAREIRLQPVDKQTRKKVKNGKIDLLGRAFRPRVAKAYREKTPRDERGYAWLDAHAEDDVYRPSVAELYAFLAEGGLQ